MTGIPLKDATVVIRNMTAAGDIPDPYALRFVIRQAKDDGSGTIGQSAGDLLHLLEKVYVSDDSVSFRAPVEAILLGRALATRLYGSARVTGEPQRPYMAALVRELCELSVGPFGVAMNAIDLLAVFVKFCPLEIDEFIREDLRGVRVIRAVARASRMKKGHPAVEDLALRLVVDPPRQTLDRPGLWIQLARRLALDGEKGKFRNRSLEAIEKMLNETEVSRSVARYGYWTLQELDDRGRESAFDSYCVDLIPVVKSARSQTTAGGSDFISAALPLDEVAGCETISSYFRETERGSVVWQGSSKEVRISARFLLLEALLSPCTLQMRFAADALRAAGPNVGEAVAEDLVGIASRLDVDFEEHVADRVAHLAGYFHASKVCTKLAEWSLDGRRPQLARTAMSSMSDIAHYDSRETEWVATMLRGIASDPDRDQRARSDAMEGIAVLRRTRERSFLENAHRLDVDNDRMTKIAEWGLRVLDRYPPVKLGEDPEAVIDVTDARTEPKRLASS